MTTPDQTAGQTRDMADSLRETIRSIVGDALNSAIPEPWEVADHAANRILARLAEEIETLRRRATMLKKSAGFATDDVARLDDENKRLRSTLTAAQAEIETLSARIGRRADEFADLLTERDGLLAQIETLRRDLAANIAARNDFARDWQKAHERADAAEAALAAAQEEIERLKNLLGDPEGVIAHADAITAMAEKDLTAAQAENARLREALKPFGEIAGEAWADENGWTEAACPRDRICDWFGPSAFLAARRAILSADMPAGGGEPVAPPAPAPDWEKAVEAEEPVAGARMLPAVEVQPADTLPEECGRLISKAYVHEGSVIALYGTNDKLIGWIDTPAWVKGRVYRDQLLPAPASDWEKAARQLMAEKDAYITLLYTDEVFVGTHWDGPPLSTDTPTWPVLCAHVSDYGAAAEEIAADDVIPLANLVKEFGRDAVQAWVCHKHNIDKPVKGDLSESGRKALAALRAAAPHLGVREG